MTSETITAIEITLDGTSIMVEPGQTIWQAAREHGIDIPILCHHEKMDPVGVCRMCVVDTGGRTLAPSCLRECEAGMTVETSNERVQKHRKMLTSLLLSDYSPQSAHQESQEGQVKTHAKQDLLTELGEQFDLIDANGGSKDETLSLFQSLRSDSRESATPKPVDSSSPVILVNHAACILCDRCIRACDAIQSNDVIGRTGKGYSARISFDLDNPMGESTCVSCGECAASCPTDALTHKVNEKSLAEINLPITSIDSVCPYCGVGCAMTYEKAGNSIVRAEGRESPVNHGRLCVKGRYGWDYTMHPQRLTKPLIRREEFYPKQPLSAEVQSSFRKKGRKPGGIVSYDEVMPAFREATWEEALDLVAQKLIGIKQEFGSGALAGFGSAKCSNEEAYLFQKLIRAGFGTNNVDHCTRLCHASSVAALMETIGSGAVTNVFADVEEASVCLITGSNTTANHPVAATFVKEATRNGTKLIVVDVRENEITKFATHFAQLKPGSDVAFYNAVMHVLILEGLIDEDYIRDFTEDYEALRTLVLAEYSPEQAAEICGISAEDITAIAYTIGEATPSGGGGSMLVFWGMGISQHTHGTDNARCLISLCLLTGNVGKPGSGLHPLRGQNNVQGASDSGLIPMVYPDYQPVTNAEIRKKFEQAWGVELEPKAGLTVVEIMHGALSKDVRGMYILGENPFLSDPNTNKVRKALTSLDFLVVQDIFLTETAEFADVILPASSFFEKTGTYTNTDRRVQLGHSVIDSPGEARLDWEIICDIARRMGQDWNYQSAAEVFDEFASLTHNYATLSHANLGATGKLWPCDNPETQDGHQILFGEGFPTPSHRGKFVPCRYEPAKELPDAEYPLILTTGRILEHWHTGSMTRRSGPLNTIEPDAFAAFHPADLVAYDIADGDIVRLASRRGEIELFAREDRSIEPGSVFVPFHFREASANILTTDALDPFGKIPEFKFCAVKVSRVVPVS